MKTTVKTIFNRIALINPEFNHVLGIENEFVSPTARRIAESMIARLIEFVPAGTLANKILSNYSTRFTEKQLWVISFELEKNQDFMAEMQQEIAAEVSKSDAKKAASKEKLDANKDASSDLLKQIKSAGKKLSDFYAFVKNTKEFAKEFYSKKYTQKSVDAFLAL